MLELTKIPVNGGTYQAVYKARFQEFVMDSLGAGPDC